MIENHEVIKLRNSWLRPLRITDSPELFKVFSDPETMRYWSHSPHQSEEQTREMIETKHLESKAKVSKYTWAITLPNETDVCVGWLSHFNINNRMIEIGYILRRDLWGQKIISEVLRHMVPDTFKRFNLHRIEALLNPENIGSLRVLEKNGFQKEGHLRENFYRNGIYEDTIVMGILRKVLDVQ